MTPSDPSEDLDVGRTRRPRGWLSMDVDRLIRMYLDIKPDSPEPELTPYWLSRLFADVDGLEVLPSCGAISDVLRRWERWGYAEVATGPLRFVRFTSKAQDLGLQGCEAEYKKSRRDKESHA